MRLKPGLDSEPEIQTYSNKARKFVEKKNEKIIVLRH